MRECTLAMRKSCKIWSACSLAYGGGEDLPPCIKESPSTDAQQLKAEILRICDEAEEQYGLKGMSEASTYFGAIRAKLSAV